MTLHFKLVITDLNGVVHAQPAVVPACQIRLSGLGASDFTFSVCDSTGSVGVWLREGCTLDFYADNFSPPTTLRLKAQLETPNTVNFGTSTCKIHCSGRELAYIDCLNAIVVETYRNKTVEEILIDLLGKYLPTYTYDIQDADFALDSKLFPYRPLKDCLDDLASVSGCCYFFTPAGCLIWREKEVVDSGLTFAASQILDAPEIQRSLIPVKNTVHVIGGVAMQLDQSQQLYDRSEKMHTVYYAQKFVPTRPDLKQISLYLGKTGNPDVLEGGIYEDSAGLPSKEINSFSYDPQYVDSSGWWVCKPSATLLIGASYWIVLKKNGDVSNTFSWFHDNLSTGSHASSADGTTWSLLNSSFTFAFKTYYSVPVLAAVRDYAGKALYRNREVVFTDESIVDYSTARSVAAAKLAELKSPFVELKQIRVLSPASFPALNSLVRVLLLGFSEQFVVNEVVLDFVGGRPTQYATFSLGQSAGELAFYIAEIKKTLNRYEAGTSGTDLDLLNLYRSAAAEAVCLDEVSPLVANSGEYLTDVAETEFSDCG